MNSLSQLIDQGIAPIRATMWGKQEPASYCACNTPPQQIAMAYNNMYATITNTHAEVINNQVFITGSLIANQNEWRRFSERNIYLGVEFELPFIEWCDVNGYMPLLSTLNGMVCIVLSPSQNENIQK